jgi:hypothetical protein
MGRCRRVCRPGCSPPCLACDLLQAGPPEWPWCLAIAWNRHRNAVSPEKRSQRVRLLTLHPGSRSGFSLSLTENSERSAVLKAPAELGFGKASIKFPSGKASRNRHAKEDGQDVKEPDMSVGSKSWAAKTVCEYYCGEGELREVLYDGTPAMLYECPRCGGRDLLLNLIEGTVRCGGRGCFSKDLDHLRFLAELEGLDFRTERRAVQEKRREIIREARDAHAATMVESREQQEVEAELGPQEAPYTPEERRAAVEFLKRQQEIAEENRRREARESRKREDEARREAVLARVTNATAAVTWRELAVALPLFLATLLAVYYGSLALQDFADYSPAPAGLEGLGIPTESGEPDSWVVSSLRGLVGWLLPDWLVPHRLPVALCSAMVVGGAWWLVRSSSRRRDGALRDGEYVGVYDRDDEGKILWR